jgi:hypothetical protein
MSTKDERIAQLKSQVASEKQQEQKAKSEQQAIRKLETGVLQAVQQVEATLDDKISKMGEVENFREEELEVLREKRKLQLKQEAQKVEKWRLHGHGELTLCLDDKDFFTQAKTSERLIVHFGRSATPRCEVLDGHLTALARKHLETKFLKVDVERSPFLCERLKIHTLPSMVLVKQGRTDKTLIGFGDFGGDDFTMEELETCLVKNQVLFPSSIGAPQQQQRYKATSSRIALDDWED